MHRAGEQRLSVAGDRTGHSALSFETHRDGRVSGDWSTRRGTQKAVKDRLRSERRRRSKRNAAAQRLKIVQRARIEPNRERLIQNRQEIRIVVDAIFKGSVWLQNLGEGRVGEAPSVGTITRVASVRLEAPRLPCTLY